MVEKYHRTMKITGEESNIKSDIVTKFQRYDNRYQILVCITDSVKQSISLDDRSQGGLHQRILIISPSCKFLDLIQLEGRVYREPTTTSKAEIYYIYGLPNNTTDIEKEDIIDGKLHNSIHFKVISNLIKKEKILKMFNGNIKFPSELPFIFYKDPVYPRN